MSTCPFCKGSLPLDNALSGTIAAAACPACGNPLVLDWRGPEPRLQPFPNLSDIRQLAPEGSMGYLLLKELPRAVNALPLLPEIAHRILGMIRDPEVSMEKLAAVIREDAVIAMAILRLANSPVYGGLQPVKDLSAACARLGMRVISNAVQATATGKMFVPEDKKLQVIMRRLWRHSIATAYCANQIAALIVERHPELLFLGGLVHDIGKVVLLDILQHSSFPELAVLEPGTELFEQIMTRFHPLVGLHVAQHWALPPELRVTTFCHHAPESCPNEEWLPMAHAVCLANVTTTLEGYGLSEAEPVFLTTHPSAHFLNLSDVKLAALRVDLADTLEPLLDAMNPQ